MTIIDKDFHALMVAAPKSNKTITDDLLKEWGLEPTATLAAVVAAAKSHGFTIVARLI